MRQTYHQAKSLKVDARHRHGADLEILAEQNGDSCKEKANKATHRGKRSSVPQKIVVKRRQTKQHMGKILGQNCVELGQFAFAHSCEGLAL